MPTKNPYSFKAKVVQRSKGQSATASSAYQAGEKITDRRTGRRHNYSKKKGVVHAEILAPNYSPGWARNRAALWNSAEIAEKRKDGQIARKFILALPRQLSHEQRVECAQGFILEQFVDRGMVADFSVHLPEVGKNRDNHHLHLLTTMRVIGPEGFGEKNRAWNKTSLLEAWREQWAAHVNRALESAGFEPTWDHRTLEEQGVDRVPQIHLGQAVIEMEQRGIRTEVGDRALEIVQANNQLEELAELEKEIHDEQQQQRTRPREPSPQPSPADRSPRATTPSCKPTNHPTPSPGGGHEQGPEKASATTPNTATVKEYIQPTTSRPVNQLPQEGGQEMLSVAEQQEFLLVQRRIAAQQQAEAEKRRHFLSQEQKSRFEALFELAEEAERIRDDHRYLDHYFAWSCLDELRQQRQTVETADWQKTESRAATHLLQNGANVEDVAGLVFDLGLSASSGSPLPPTALKHLQNLACNSPDLAAAMRTAEQREKDEARQRSEDSDRDHHHKPAFPKLPGAA